MGLRDSNISKGAGIRFERWAVGSFEAGKEPFVRPLFTRAGEVADDICRVFVSYVAGFVEVVANQMT